jgi:phenylalanine-4-hydroxylase
MEDDKLRIYGAGILSSFGESNSSLYSNEIERLDFDLMTILDTNFCTSEMQTNYFIIDSLMSLKNSINTLTNKWQINELECFR